MVRLFLQREGHPRIEAVCVAVAGPVSGGQARLTNRDWSFSEQRLLELTGAGRARLINDLTALGYATPALSGDAAGFLTAPPQAASSNGQRLVVNAGTGFNVCAVKVLPSGGIACLEAEEGHTRLPLSIATPLAEALGTTIPAAAARFESVEELFAGRGSPICTSRCTNGRCRAPRRCGPRRSPPPSRAIRRPRRAATFMPGCSG